MSAAINRDTIGTALEERLHTFEKEMKEVIDAVSTSKDLKLQRKLSKMMVLATRKAETPGDAMWRIMFTVHEFARVRTIIDLQVAEQLASLQGEVKAMTLDEPGPATGADTVLLLRLLRVLVALDFFDEPAPDTFALNEKSLMLATEPSLSGGLKLMFDVLCPPALAMPEFLRETSYKNPEGPYSAFRRAFGDVDFFQHLMQHPSSMQDFTHLMAGQRMHRQEWFEYFPVSERLLSGLETDRVLIVDIGGNSGHELRVFRQAYPEVKAKLVLQDLENVLSTVSEQDLQKLGIEKMCHDFFLPQPVIGARAYYFRSVLHDWPDDRCREILRNIAVAMESGYSKIIINDWVLPDSKCALYPATLDINLLAGFCGMERNIKQWRKHIEGTGLGLQITAIHTMPDTESCIEIEKVTGPTMSA